MNLFIPNTKIIKNYAPLNVDQIPDSIEEIIHREKELTTMRYHFASVFSHEAPRPLFIYGSSGTGKTVIVRVITKLLETTAASEGINVFCPYVNCAISKSPFMIFKDLAEQYSLKTKKPLLNLTNSATHQLNNFIEGLNAFDGISVIVLDEIDKSSSQDVMYALSRLMGNGKANKRVGLICVSNDLKYTNTFDPRTLSSLAKKDIKLNPYNGEELTDIITKRAELALYENTYNEGVLTLCAALTAKRDSDARKAITLLHDAAETTQVRGLPEITEDIVRECERTMRQELETLEIIKLPLQLKLALAATMYSVGKSHGGKSTIAEVYTNYLKCCDKTDSTPYKRRTFIELLQELDLQSYIDITKTSSGRGKGVQNIITTNADQIEITTQLLEDSLLTGLKELFNPLEKYA